MGKCYNAFMWKKYWHRLRYRSEGNPFPTWLYLTFLLTFANGIAFTFFGHTQTVQASVLFQLTAVYGHGFVSAWGIVAVAAVVMSTINLLFRYRPVSGAGPWLGYVAWLFAAWVYLTHGYWLQLVSAFCWFVFWFMHHRRLHQYRRNVDSGREIPPA